MHKLKVTAALPTTGFVFGLDEVVVLCFLFVFVFFVLFLVFLVFFVFLVFLFVLFVLPYL